MARLFLFLLLFACTCGFSQSDTLLTSNDYDELTGPLGVRRKELIGKPFGNFSAVSDSLFTARAFKEKVVFVNFWFEACVPCITELDGLNELYKQTKDSAGFLFISFTYEPTEKLKSLREKYGINYPVYHLNHDDCIHLNQGLGFPTNILIDKSGTITHLTSSGPRGKKQATAFLLNEFYARILALLQKP